MINKRLSEIIYHKLCHASEYSVNSTQKNHSLNVETLSLKTEFSLHMNTDNGSVGLELRLLKKRNFDKLR